MSRCSSRHKSTNRPVSLSRHHGTSNGYLSLKSKYSQRYNLANGADDAHHHHRRTRRHRSRDCKQSCHHQSSRRSSSGSQRNYRRRYRHITSPHDENTTTNAAKRSKLSSSARRQLSYSTSIATRSPPINSKLSPTHVRKLHSTNPLPSSASTSVRVSPATCKQEVAITTLTAARPATKSSLSLSPPMVQSPPSPTSSFGASFFGKQHAHLVNPSPVPVSEDVYIPDLVPLLGSPDPTTATKNLLGAPARNIIDKKNSTTVDCVTATVPNEMDDEDGVVTMDVSLSPPVHRSPAASPLIPFGEHQMPPAAANCSSTFGNDARCGVDGQLTTDKGDDMSSGTSSMSGPSAGIEVSKATKAHNQRLQARRNELMPVRPVVLPPLHLHMSKDGTSPLPPGWLRAAAPPNTTDEDSSGGTYAYYYYHTKTRQTRWDPPIYPWDADPEDNLIPDRSLDDPEAPYNWDCAHRYAVTHEEIEAMYSQCRLRILERQCMEMIHEMGSKPDAPQGAQEQGFAIELFTLIHNELRQFRDARVNLGRITNDEDLFYLTNKLAQEVIPKEIRSLHRVQQAKASSLFTAIIPEVTSSIRERATSYVRRYMESKGPCYRRYNPPAPPPFSQAPSSHHRHNHQ